MTRMETSQARELARRLRPRWTEFLQQRRLNTTQQREAIVEAFLRSREHVSIEELLARVRKKNPHVGYATVYRTLRLLVEAGLANPRQFDEGQTRYEVAGDHHDHLICIECNLILEFESPEVEKIQEEIAARLGGFKVLRHKHELYCLCPRAQGIPGGACPNEERKKLAEASASTSMLSSDPTAGTARTAGSSSKPRS